MSQNSVFCALRQSCWIIMWTPRSGILNLYQEFNTLQMCAFIIKIRHGSSEIAEAVSLVFFVNGRAASDRIYEWANVWTGINLSGETIDRPVPTWHVNDAHRGRQRLITKIDGDNGSEWKTSVAPLVGINDRVTQPYIWDDDDVKMKCQTIIHVRRHSKFPDHSCSISRRHQLYRHNLSNVAKTIANRIAKRAHSVVILFTWAFKQAVRCTE